MRFTVEPGNDKTNGTCDAIVLTDPADPKSPKAICCKATPVWQVRYQTQVPGSRSLGACPSHLNMLLTDLNEGWDLR